LKHRHDAAPLAFACVALFTSAWIETKSWLLPVGDRKVALFTSAWIETLSVITLTSEWRSRSSRARGLKRNKRVWQCKAGVVALFTSAWIETLPMNCAAQSVNVALFTSAWIETFYLTGYGYNAVVALFTSAWIETGLGFP